MHGTIDCTLNRLVIGGVDVCNAINTILASYEHLVKQHELEQRAKALEIVKTVVPKLPSEWGQLVYNISTILLENRSIRTFYVYQGSSEVVLGIYCYEDGYYRECEQTLEKDIEDLVSKSTLLDAKIVPSLRGNILRKIEGKTLAPYEPAKRCLLFKNRVFCWDLFLQTKDLEKLLLDPNPELIVTHRIPWRIRPELYKIARPGLLKYVPPQSVQDLVELFRGLAPKSFKAFLDWVKCPGEREEETYPRVVLLLEITGYTLYPHEYPFNKAILLVGKGSNGKTTYLKLISKILGDHNIASVNLAELSSTDNRFVTYMLWNKLANISSEPAKAMRD